jgi:Family of unknown function (DUF5723)
MHIQTIFVLDLRYNISQIYFAYFYLSQLFSMRKVSVLIIFSTFFAQILRGQQEQALHFATDVWQSNTTNPAFVSKKKIVVALPSLYYNYSSPNATILDIKNAANGLNTLNKATANLSLQTLGLSFPLTSALRLNVHHAANVYIGGSINKNLASLYDKGNAQFIGQTIDFASNLTTSIYNEWAVGVTYKVQESLSLGARVKYLTGNFHSKIDLNKATIRFEDSNYALNFDNDIKVTTFGIGSLDSIKSPGNALTSQRVFTSNTGFAFDLGGSMKLGRLTFNVSVIDLGAGINWSENGKSSTTKGTYSYSGLNADNFFKFDSISSKSFQDTLENIVGLVENTEESLRQNLPTKIYLSTFYELTEKIRLGTLLYSEIDTQDTRFGFVANATYKMSELLTVGGTLGLRNGSFDNLGLSAIAKLGPVQLYAVTDNIIGAFKPLESKNSNARLGINLIF